MRKGERVTLFNDMCLLAPATMIDKNIQGTVIDALATEATFPLQAIRSKIPRTDLDAG